MTSAADLHARMPDPHDVYQQWLDATSGALLSGACEAIADAIFLPFVMRTVAGETVLETREDLLLDARNATKALRARPGAFVGRWRAAQLMLCQSGGGWRCSVLTNPLSNTEVAGPEFQISDGLPTLRHI